MKYLIIERGQAKYTVDANTRPQKSIDKISKDDLLKLIDLCMNDESFEMDPYDERELQNKAHQIIYKNIYRKLDDITKKRVSFSDEMTSLYRSAIEKYSVELKKRE